ncbi:DUF2971 domain-containing protein [Rhizobium sp. ZW T2_16]|uniref:DUF2971 domain-containing protein n=1 Tax=Rhizobium sp. ZW T2_16 TaxID=3378083 RepID=UPI00385283A3
MRQLNDMDGHSIMKIVQPPKLLYRYRPLDDQLLNREMEALKQSYLFSPSFKSMNDPMEAFYETGGPSDHIIDALFFGGGKKLTAIYDEFSALIDKFALVSFSSSHEDLPLWAYYGSNFAGMCLEFETSELSIGDFQGEQLLPVSYAKSALPPLTMADFGGDRLKNSIHARITRKRSEWAHEKEWRYLTGEVGPKHYVDGALKRVFLGPRITPDHASAVCETLESRQVEVLQGSVDGYELKFRTLKASVPLEDCERVGAGIFDPSDHSFAETDITKFLSVPYSTLMSECRRIALDPNLEAIESIDISGSKADLIYLLATYKLRNGRLIFRKRYYDKHLIARDISDQ